MSEGALVQDLAALTAIVGVVAVLFSKFQLPKVIGYLLAGVLMSEYTWGGSFLADTSSVRILGQLGVVFLMFSMGIDFSPSRLKSVKGIAFPVAIIDTSIMMWIGYTIGTRIFGWSATQSIFLGAAICDSATTMLGKVIDEMKWSNKPFVHRAIGSSVCEDMICIGILALISGIQQGQGVSLVSLGSSMGALGIFLLAVIVFGFAHVPRYFESIHKLQDEETLLLSVLGCCFFVSYLAYRFEYSLSLGAFLVGVIAATSSCRHKIAELAGPLRTLFAAVFFVSIGVLVDPVQCINYIPQILLLTVVVVVCKFFNCTISSIVCGESVKTSIQIGMSLAQIGEFAFMVALLYVGNSGDWSNPMYQIAVAVSILTTILNPFMIRWSEPFGTWVEKRLGEKNLRRLETYRGLVAKFRFDRSDASSVRQQINKCILTLGVVAALIVAVAVAMSILSSRDWSNFSELFNKYKQAIFCLTADLFVIAMLAPIASISKKLGILIGEVLFASESVRWRESLQKLVEHVVVGGVFVLFFAEVTMLNINLAPQDKWSRIAIFLILIISGVLGWKRFSKLSRSAIQRFKSALEVDARVGSKDNIKNDRNNIIEHIGGVTHYKVADNSPAIGQTLISLNIRARTGALVVQAERAGATFGNPGGNWKIKSGDMLVVLGDDAQINAFEHLMEDPKNFLSEIKSETT
jgi:CPA2 family monovalent cation:H+ antiporter-2